MKRTRFALIATTLALTTTPAIALSAPASASAASMPIVYCNHNSWTTTACLHAGIWWNSSTSGVYWQWPQCINNAWPIFTCQESQQGHWYLGNGQTDLWQTSGVESPVGKFGANEWLCVHINYIVGRYGPVAASTSQWLNGGGC